MPPADTGLPLRHAVALGLLHGPAELLPVSSSGHTTLIPWLAGWPYAELDGELRKAFEVSLHAGTALALAIDMRGEIAAAVRRREPREALVLALALLPPAIAGLGLGPWIERRLGGPRSIAIGLAAGAVAMAIADTLADGEAGGARGCEQADAIDGLILGLAQATALAPGVSRNGATLTAARARGFGRGAAQSLSWGVALPVILGASLVKIGDLPDAARGLRAAFLGGAAAAFASTLASARILRAGGGGRGWRALLPYSVYRCLLAAVVLTRTRRPQ